MSYTQQILQAQERFENMDLNGEREPAARQLAFFSANLHQFLPHIPWDAHEQLYRQMCLHQHLSHLDVRHPRALDELHISGWGEQWAAQLVDRPGIICTFHTGSYRLLALLLARAGVRYALLLSQATLHHEGTAFSNGYHRHAPQGGTLPLVNAEKPSSALECYRLLRKGYSVLIYPDGNRGNGTGAHMREIPFLDHRMRVRTGPAHLAHAFKYPVYRVLCGRTALTAIRYQGMEVMAPNGRAETFIGDTMNKLYQALAALLRDEPAQWTCWPQAHFHTVGPRKLPKATDKPGQWATFTLDGQAYLFDKLSYRSYPIARAMLKSYRAHLLLE